MQVHSFIEDGCQQLGLSLVLTQTNQLAEYLQLIKNWNKAYNLVGTSDLRELLIKHILDSLAMTRFIQQGPVVDVGSGAGLPGIPLAIALPDISFTLIDSNGKKARFMRQAVMELQLNNVEIVQTRVEQFQAFSGAKVALARAYAPLEKALVSLRAVCEHPATVNIMLGLKPESLPQVPGLGKFDVQALSVPGLDSQRHVLIAQTEPI